jgi:2-keto-3-deoxy-L-rhamnonate aldolase RhmA
VALIIQIEHARAVENIDAILATPGIDGVLIGPYDLSASMGLMGQVQHARVRETISLVRGKCRAKSIPVGGFSLTIEGAKEAIQNGCSFVAVGTDMLLLSNAAKDSLAQLRSGPGKS